MRQYSICLIGNSHLAALAQAWRADRLGAANTVSIAFFGARAGSLRAELKEGTLMPTDKEVEESWRLTSGGQASIVLREHDAFVLYGMGFNLHGLLSVLADYGTSAELAWGPIKHLISRDCMHVLLRSAIARGIALQLLQQIRPKTAAPVLLCPIPFRAEGAIRGAVAKRPRLSNPEFMGYVVRQFETKAADLCEAAGGVFIPQDESTRALPGVTRAEFVLGGENWAGTKETPDDKHMNERYGAIMLAKILRHLNSLSGGGLLDSAHNGWATDSRHADE